MKTIEARMEDDLRQKQSSVFQSKQLSAAEEIRQDKAKLECDINNLLNEFTRTHGDMSIDINTEVSYINTEAGRLIGSSRRTEINLKL